MKPHIKLFFILLIALVNSQISAQNNNVKLKGIVKNDNHYLQDINVLNKSTRLGTSSRKNGEFTIFVSKGDSIEFSSIVYKNRKIKISDTHINSKSITVFLEADFNQLEEVYLKQGFRLEIGDVRVDERAVLKNDKNSIKEPINSIRLTDPTAQFEGISLRGLFKLFTKKRRLKKHNQKIDLEKINQLKKEFPITLRNTYGDSFFKEWLHISEDKINLFLDYCQDNGLPELYSSDEFLIKNFLFRHAKIFKTFDKK